MDEQIRMLSPAQCAEVASDLMQIKAERECMSREAKRAIEDIRSVRAKRPILHWVYSLLH